MPLAIRWTVGPTSEIGMRMLCLSVRSFRRFHPADHLLIAVNGLQPQFQDELARLGVPVYRQRGDELPVPPKGAAWKLYPPRFFPDSHELMVDNDIVLVATLPQVHTFLNSSAILYSRSVYRAYGAYRPPAGLYINSGLLGLPPGYDFRSELLRTMGDRKWRDAGSGLVGTDGHFDEQGCVAETIARHHRLIEVSLNDLNVCHSERLGTARYGYHFVSSNRRQHNRAWDEFLDRRHKSIPMA